MGRWARVGHRAGLAGVLQGGLGAGNTGGGRVLGVSSGPVGSIYSKFNMNLKELPLFKNWPFFSFAHVDMWWIGTMRQYL